MHLKGATLIELLAVVAIIGFLAGISWPSLIGLQARQQSRQAAEMIANLLRSAQERTLAEQLVYGVTVNLANETAILQSYGESYDGPSDPDLVTVETVVLDNPTGDIISTTLNGANTDIGTVRFNFAGLPSQPGQIVVSGQTGGTGPSFTVEVTTAGSVKVYQP